MKQSLNYGSGLNLTRSEISLLSLSLRDFAMLTFQCCVRSICLADSSRCNSSAGEVGGYVE